MLNLAICKKGDLLIASNGMIFLYKEGVKDEYNHLHYADIFDSFILDKQGIRTFQSNGHVYELLNKYHIVEIVK